MYKSNYYTKKQMTLHFVGPMYKRNYYTQEQMTKYKMQMDANKTWLHTLQFFTKLIAQGKAYGDDHAAISGFDNAVHINNIPIDCSLVLTSSDITTCNLYIKSIEEPRSAPLPWTKRTRRTYYTQNLTPNASILTSS
jgi:hypothetical protein